MLLEFGFLLVIASEICGTTRTFADSSSGQGSLKALQSLQEGTLVLGRNAAAGPTELKFYTSNGVPRLVEVFAPDVRPIRAKAVGSRKYVAVYTQFYKSNDQKIETIRVFDQSGNILSEIGSNDGDVVFLNDLNSRLMDVDAYKGHFDLYAIDGSTIADKQFSDWSVPVEDEEEPGIIFGSLQSNAQSLVCVARTPISPSQQMTEVTVFGFDGETRFHKTINGGFAMPIGISERIGVVVFLLTPKTTIIPSSAHTLVGMNMLGEIIWSRTASNQAWEGTLSTNGAYWLSNDGDQIELKSGEIRS